MASFDGYSHFWKASHQRLRDAEELLQPPTLAPEDSDAMRRHLRAAYYLAGYAVECILKAYLIASHSDTASPQKATLSNTQAKIRATGLDIPDLLSSKGHNLLILFQATNLDSLLPRDAHFRRQLGLSLKWSPGMRYNPKAPGRAEVEGYLSAAKLIHDNVRRYCGV